MSVQQNCAHIAAAEVHGCHIVPRVCVQVKLAHTVEILDAVKATEAVETIVVDHCAMVGTWRFQILFNIDPIVGAEVVGFDAFGWIVSTPATNSQQDFLREARTSDCVYNSVARREVLSHQILDLQGVFHHLQAFSISANKLIQFYVNIDEVFIYQSEADL